MEAHSNQSEAGPGTIRLDGNAPSELELARARSTADLLEALLPSLTDEGAAAQLLCELAELRFFPLGDAQASLDLMRDAFRRSPQNHVARAYCRAAIRAGSIDDQLVALEMEARTAQTAPQQASLEAERGVLLEQLGTNPPAARQAYAAAVERHPAELSSLLALLRIAERNGDVEAQIAACRGIADATSEATVRGDYLARAARLCDSAGRADAAQMMALEAAVCAPASEPVRFLLERVFAKTAQARELCALLESQIVAETVPPIETWFDVGMLARYALGDLALAERAFQHVAVGGEGVSQRAALAELASLWGRAGNWSAALEAEEKLVEHESAPLARAMAWVRIGTIREERIGDLGKAAEAYAHAVEADAGYVPALAAAGRAFAKLGETERLLWIHRSEAEHAASPMERANALRRAGEKLVADPARLEEGVELLEEALRAVPDHAGVFGSLERALRKKRSYAELASLYERELGRATQPSRRAWLSIQIGGLAADRLDDPRRAIAAFRDAAQVPDVAHDHALERLAQLLDDCGELSELEPVLERLRSATKDPGQLASLLERAATLQEGRGDLSAACETYLAAVEIAPTSHAVHASAGRAFARAGRWDAVIDQYERVAAQAPPAERASYRYKVALVLARRLDRTDDAITKLEAIRAELPGHAPTLAMLASMYEEAQRWNALGPVLAELPQSPTLLARRAMFAELRGELEEALGLWSAAIDSGLTSAGPCRARVLARLQRWPELAHHYLARVAAAAPGRQQQSAAYRAAEIVFEREGDAARALGVLDGAVPDDRASVPMLLAKVRLGGPDAARKRIELVLAQVQEPALRAVLYAQLALDPEVPGSARLTALASQLALVPRDPVVTQRLEHVLTGLGRRSALVEMFREQLRDLRPGEPATTALSVRLGVLLEDLGSPREAADAFELAATASPPSLRAAVALPSLYAVLGDDVRVLAAMRALAEVLPSGEARATVLRRISHRQRRAGDTAAAAATLEEAMRANARDFDALRALDALVGQAEAERLIDPLMRAFTAEPASAQRQHLGLALAVRQMNAGRLAAAGETLDRLLAEDEQDLRSLLLGAELGVKVAAWSAAAGTLKRVIAHVEVDPLVREHALQRLAHVQLDELDDLEGARETAAQLREAAPSGRSGIELALRIAERGDDHRTAAALIASLLAHPDLEEEARADRQLELATLQEDRLDDIAGAIETLGAIKLAARRRAAVDRLLELGGRTGRWDLAASALEATLDREGELDPPWELAIRNRLAHLLEGPLARPDAAIRQYERIVALDPHNLAALEQLALLAVGSPARAITWHRALLDSDPTRLGSYLALRQLFIELADEDGAFLAEAVLESIGGADEEATYFYKQRRARLRAPLAGELTAAERALLFPEASDPAFALLRLLGPALAAVFPVDLGSYGVSAPEAMHSGSTFESAQRIARLLDVPAFELVAVPNRVRPSVEPGSPPLLFVPRSVDDAAPREQAAILGELFARVSFDGVLGASERPGAISPTLLEYLLWAACELAVPDATAPARGKAVYEDVKRRLSAAIEALPRAPLADAASALVRAGGFDAAAVLASMERAALRVALFAAQDPLVGFTHLRARHAPDGVGLERLSTSLRCVLPFLVSDEHMQLRKRLGMGVAS